MPKLIMKGRFNMAKLLRKVEKQNAGRIGSDITFQYLNPFGKRAVQHVLPGLPDGRRININPPNAGIGRALGCHKCNKAASAANVQNQTAAGQICPGS